MSGAHKTLQETPGKSRFLRQRRSPVVPDLNRSCMKITLLRHAPVEIRDRWICGCRLEHLLREYDAIVKAAEHCVVDRADGISEVEAYKIAKDHLQAIGKYTKRVVFRPTDANECWLISYPLSLIGGIDLLFEVSKKDGAIKEKANRVAGGS